MVLEEMPKKIEFISVPECDDSSSDDDAVFVPRRARYFSGILAAQKRSRAKEEVMLYGEDDDERDFDEDFQLEVSPPHQTLREYLFQIMPPEWCKEIETANAPDAGADAEKKDEDVELPSAYPPGYETPDARLKLLQREVHALCHGNGYLNIDNLKPDSQDFVDGVLDCAFEEAMGRCAMVEAKAAKRRAKRHRKREMDNLRRCMDRKRRLEDNDDIIHYRDAPAIGVKIDIDVEFDGQAEQEEKRIDGKVKEEDAFGVDGRIKDEICIADGGGLPNASISISREPCSTEELGAEQRELIMEFNREDDGDSSEEEFMDTCPQDDSERSSSFE